ncbi:hypothetical protein HNR39_001961 [Glaciimonas immobilis]|uniref:Uncharacterized protein n=1 Tax=Glaciimonas immobilis TaxID=728004 RepID=A0A840RT55_9BURK|nr:hypothetical protein [Glaciimonas immobilis]
MRHWARMCLCKRWPIFWLLKRVVLRGCWSGVARQPVSLFCLARRPPANKGTKQKATAEAWPAVGGSPIISTVSRVEIPTRWRSNRYSDNSRLTAEITGNAYDGVGQLPVQRQPQPPLWLTSFGFERRPYSSAADLHNLIAPICCRHQYHPAD